MELSIKRIVSVGIAFLMIMAADTTVADQELIRVGIRPAAPPFCFLSKENGKIGLRGINIDLTTMIRRLLNIQIKYVNCASLEQRRQWLLQGRIDMIAIEPVTHTAGADIRYIPADLALHRRLFVHDSCRTVVCVKDLSTKRVVTIAGDNYFPFVHQVKKNKLIVVDTSLEALGLLNKGLVDAFVAPSELVAQYIIQTENLAHIVRVGIVIEDIPLAFAIRADDEQLYERLTEAVVRLRRAGTIGLIRDKWYGVVFQPTVWQRYSRMILVGLSLVVAGLLIITVWNYQLKKRVRKITEDLHTSERKYRNLIESSPDMIFVVNGDGRIQHANKGALTIFSEAIVKNGANNNLTKLVVKKERDELVEFLSSVFSLGSATREFHFLNVSGQVREVDMAATRILSEITDDPLVCCFIRDVTNRNRIERELIQADRFATIGKMAAGVAHEINNPLGIIRANIELISARGWLAEEAKESLEAIRRNTVRAGKITQDLLAVARPKEPEMATVELSELVKMTLAILGPQFKGIEIEQHQCPNPTQVRGDRNLLQQVLVNVFLNARAAMKESQHRKIRIACCASPNESTICLRIEDSGKGILKAHLTKIFEPFFSYGKKEGFGLGLFVSRRIIERHNGIIFAESEYGKGTQITIELPLFEIHSRNKTAPKATQSEQRR